MSDKKAAGSKKTKETRSFQAETKELLNLMVNSLYTHREIFLRELISNASDALDKVNFQSLTKPKILEENADLKIILNVDKDKKTLSIYDNGIGMTYKEVIENIGTIARSGSKSFIEKLKAKDDVELIGKFGVGFYSAFMVSDKVVLISRAAGEKIGTRWESTGDGSYTIEKIGSEPRGTRITLQLRENCYNTGDPAEDFLNQYTIQNLIKKYSDYIRYPIEMDFYREEPERDKDGKIIAGGKTETIIDRKTLNSVTPIWERNKKEISRDEYFQFFKHHFHDWNEYADVVHFKAEGNVEYTALLFIPTRASSDLYDKNFARGIQLYSNHVFVMNDCRDLLPDHLRFVRGLIDSPDFSLNISREILQHNRQLQIIGKNLEKKVLESLKKLLKDNRKLYEETWQEFGKAIKGGIYMEYKNKEKLEDLVLFYTSSKEEGMTTLREYVERMPAGQEEIYYATGKDIETIKRMPQLEVFREKKIEILYFVDKIDEFLTQNLDKYDDRKLKSVTRQDLKLEEIIGDKKETARDKKESQKEEKGKDKAGAEDVFKKKEEKYKDVLAAIENHLGEKVAEVRLSKRLTSSPVCLVTTGSGVTFNMEMLLQGVNQPSAPARKILELNPDHKLFSVLEKLYKQDKDSADLKNASEILFNQACLIEGFELDNPVEFSQHMGELLVKAYE
ncbi:MAG: molecular chaperone HtpG [Candidatus Aminicenantes bacterium]|nr:molecular chaperone HtpG [Candidatus Aminicenantes bacterium]